MLCFVLLCSVCVFHFCGVCLFYVFSAHRDSTRGQTKEWRGDPYQCIVFTITLSPVFATPSECLGGRFFYLVVFHIVGSKVVFFVCLFLHLKCKHIYTSLRIIFKSTHCHSVCFAFIPYLHLKPLNYLLTTIMIIPIYSSLYTSRLSLIYSVTTLLSSSFLSGILCIGFENRAVKS